MLFGAVSNRTRFPFQADLTCVVSRQATKAKVLRYEKLNSVLIWEAPKGFTGV